LKNPMERSSPPTKDVILEGQLRVCPTQRTPRNRAEVPLPLVSGFGFLSSSKVADELSCGLFAPFLLHNAKRKNAFVGKSAQTFISAFIEVFADQSRGGKHKWRP
jgi:hypothetical protein